MRYTEIVTKLVDLGYRFLYHSDTLTNQYSFYGNPASDKLYIVEDCDKVFLVHIDDITEHAVEVEL